jgi:hypothetical protein
VPTFPADLAGTLSRVRELGEMGGIDGRDQEKGSNILMISERQARGSGSG